MSNIKKLHSYEPTILYRHSNSHVAGGGIFQEFVHNETGLTYTLKK